MGKREISRKNLVWSVAALVLVLLLIPAALGGLNAMNDAYSGAYVTTYDASEVLGHGASIYGYWNYGVTAKYTNTTSSAVYANLTGSYFADANGTTDTLFVSYPADASSVDVVIYNYNYTLQQLYDNDTSVLYYTYHSSETLNENMTLGIYQVCHDDGLAPVSSTTVLLKEYTIELVNGSASGRLAISNADMLLALSSIAKQDIVAPLEIRLSYETSSFADSEQIDFQFTFQGQRGVSESSMTPYIVGGLGGFLLVSAVAATDVVDPLSPGKKIHLWKRKGSGHRRRRRRW